jgi:hypothetical protein
VVFVVPAELLIAAALTFLSLLLLGMLLMRHWPRVIVAAPVSKHPCGFVPNV